MGGLMMEAEEEIVNGAVVVGGVGQTLNSIHI